MRILLIQPPFYGFQNITSDRLYLGLAYLAAVLEKDGHEVLILNGEFYFEQMEGENEKITIDQEAYKKNFKREHYVYQKILNDVIDFKPDAIAISFMTAGSTSAYFLAQHITRAIPDIPLIAGGIHPTLLPEEPLKKGFNYVIRGEGEVTIVELIKAIQNKSNDLETILGISYLSHGQIYHNQNRPFIADLDALPFPAFYLMKDYQKHAYASSGIITSRGCPFTCTYCASKLLWTRQVRFRSPKNIVNEIIDRHKKYGLASFAFHDDTFTLNRKYVEQFCLLVLKLSFKISWHCDTRGDTLDLNLLKLMKRAGCQHIYLGLESGSPKIQKLIKKNLSTVKVKQAIKMARQARIETTVYFMVGFPEETEEDIKQSIAVMKDLKPDHAIWGILTPYPGTEIWQLAIKKGLVNYQTDWANYFHHYNQGNIFGSVSKESWDKLLKEINEEQNKLNSKLTIIKIKAKIKNNFYLLKLAIKKPSKAINYIKKRIKI